MYFPSSTKALDEGTQGLIRDLLRQRDKTRRQLDASQTDQVVIRGQLSNANTKVASKFLWPCPFL
jgi:hypothetical protein